MALPNRIYSKWPYILDSRFRLEKILYRWKGLEEIDATMSSIFSFEKVKTNQNNLDPVSITRLGSLVIFVTTFLYLSGGYG